MLLTQTERLLRKYIFTDRFVCGMREYKFGSKFPNFLLVAVSQAKLAICKGYRYVKKNREL